MRSNFATPLKAVVVFACLMFSSLSAGAQTANVRSTRVTQAVDENNLITLHGNTHPMAQSKYDQGPAPDALPMDRMLMVLQRSSDQQMALKAFMDEQHAKSSPNFHQWLTPEQFGQQFGVSDADIQTVTGWLQTHGFQVNNVATGKMLIEFSGTAGQIKEAFHTQIHKYLVNGEAHWANASDPQIPAALAPVIKGVNTMHNFKKKPMIHAGKPLHLQDYSGKGTPQFTVSNCNINPNFSNPIFNNTCFGLSPADFATIYNIPSTFHGSNLNGTGQTVAVIGDSDICTGAPLPAGCVADDVVAFRTLFGLSGNNTQIYVDGVDPGLNGDELEGILDVEWVGAIAPSAKVLFVIAGDTESSAGIDLAAQRVVDNNLAGVMTESFGECEQALSNSENSFYATLWEQAAAQGITVILATGDSGSAGCDSSNSESDAVNGAAVSGFASTPYAVAVGGTDFDYSATGYPSTYWNASSSSNSSAKSYIPETSWDDSCGQSQPTLSPAINSNCVNLTALQKTYLLNISGGGGGQSDCAFVSGGECFGYITPPWQVGVGVPTGGFRYIPDLSLFAAVGDVSNSFYVVCESDQVAPSPSCTGSNFSFLPVGGTSASAQAFGGIMALVNQAMAETGNSPRQGNANYALYPLFAAQTNANLNCNSSLFTPGTPLSTGCTFRDITKGTNTVFCAPGSQNCN
jgi:subtilase family serine protease